MSRLRCPECGAEIRPARVGRPAVYCGQICRQRAHRARRASATFAAFDRATSIVSGLEELPVSEMRDIAGFLKEIK